MHMLLQDQLLRNRISDCSGVVLLGGSASGKTTLFYQLLQNHAPPDPYKPTVHSVVAPLVLRGGAGKAGM